MIIVIKLEEIHMEFDKEMDDAAAKIQKHYREKKKNNHEKQQKEEIHMEFDKEMDDAAAKIQKHYRNKKKAHEKQEPKKEQGN